MNILLTGGAGYIGSHTAVKLIEKGHNVVIADNYSNSDPVVIDRIEAITGVRPAAYEADVAVKGELGRIFDAHGIDAVMHFAGYKAVEESIAQPLKYYGNNLGGLVTVLSEMKKHGVRRLIFSSSATVYGRPPCLPITEDMPTGEVSNPYGSTKCMMEQIIRDCAVAQAGFSAVLVRYFNPIGAHPSGLIGEAPMGVPCNIMPYITQVAVGRLPYLSVFGDDYDTPDGTCIRDYIHIEDLAEGHVSALKYCEDIDGADAVNLGTGKGCSVLGLVRAFKEATGVDIPYRIAKRRAGDLPECWAAVDKAKRLMGWEAKRNVYDMCRDAWNWQRHNPNGYEG